jgi:ABC-type transport system substrate-binding protein
MVTCQSFCQDYHLNICPSKGDGNIDWESGVGAGPYTLEEHEPGVRTLTKKFANYHNTGNDSFFDEIETLGINDPTARMAALSTGAVDAINNVPAKTAARLKSMVNVKTLISTGNKQATMPMLCDMDPYTDQNVRNAMKHIVNRQELLDKIFFGYGQLGNDNPVGPANYFRATEDELPQREYDPEKAKYYLKQAGMSSLSVKFHAADTGFSGSVDAGALMRESAKAAGIDIEVVREPNDGYWSNVWMNKAVVSMLLEWPSNRRLGYSHRFIIQKQIGTTLTGIIPALISFWLRHAPKQMKQSVVKSMWKCSALCIPMAGLSFLSSLVRSWVTVQASMYLARLPTTGNLMVTFAHAVGGAHRSEPILEPYYGKPVHLAFLSYLNTIQTYIFCCYFIYAYIFLHIRTNKTVSRE